MYSLILKLQIQQTQEEGKRTYALKVNTPQKHSTTERKSVYLPKNGGPETNCFGTACVPSSALPECQQRDVERKNPVPTRHQSTIYVPCNLLKLAWCFESWTGKK